jgi:small subunit ribosomal protein S6
MVSKRVTRKAPAKKAAKVEESLRNYELVYIIKPDIAEDSLEPVIEKVNQMISGKGGKISGSEKWGKRKLAYPIKHYLEGNYIFNKVQLSPKASRELEANLQITEELLRFLVVQV